MKLKIKKLHPDVPTPEFATDGSACFDLKAWMPAVDEYMWPHLSKEFGTGLCVEIPAHHAMLIFSRSGHGFKSNVRLANCVGVIDSDYRGEIKVKLTMDHMADKLFVVNHGDRIAQAMVVPVAYIDAFVVVDELGDTARGASGFGSTGS